MNDTATCRYGHSRRERKQNIRAFCFMIPGLVGLYIFFLKPFATVVGFSFSDNALTRRFAGFKNFTELFGNDAFRHAVLNSAFLALAGTFLLITASLPVAEFISHAKRFTSALKTIMMIPFIMPAASIALVFSMLTDHSRFLIGVFQAIGVGDSHSVSGQYAMLFILLLFLWKNMGYMVLLFGGSLLKADQNIIEAAKLDGAGVIRIFFEIKLRSISPSIVFGVLLSIMSSFGMYREVFLIYGSHPPASVYLISHYLSNTMGMMNYSKMSAAALVVMLSVVALSVILIAVEKRYGRGMEQ